MGKKKKGGKGKGGGSKSKQPVDIEIPPEPSTLTLLYRKASFDVRSEPLQGLLRIQYDKVSARFCLSKARIRDFIPSTTER